MKFLFVCLLLVFNLIGKIFSVELIYFCDHVLYNDKHLALSLTSCVQAIYLPLILHKGFAT